METLKSLLRNEADIDWLEVDDAVVCNYADGSDYLIWREEPDNPAAAVELFKLINHRRSRVIDALRWCAHLTGYTLDFDFNGAAHLANSSMSCTGQIGRELSELLEKVAPEDAYEQISRIYHLTCDQKQWSKALEAGSFTDRSREALQEMEPDQSDDSLTPFFMAMLDPEIMEDVIEDAKLTGNAKNSAKKHPRWALSAKLSKKFGDKFALEIIDNSFVIDLNDGGTYTLTKEDLDDRLSEQDPDSVFEQICEDYAATNHKRTEGKRMLFDHMAALGYAVDERDDIYIFGKTKNEFEFDPENDLHSDNYESDIMIWLIEHELPTETPVQPAPAIIKKALPDTEPVALPNMDAYDLELIDKKAKALLENYQREGMEDMYFKWASPRWHRPAKDLWMTDDWWRAKAIQRKDDMLLVGLGDEEALQRIIARMKEVADKTEWDASFAIYEGYCPLQAWLARDHVWPNENPVHFYENNESARPMNNHWLKFFRSIPYEIKRYAKGKVLFALNSTDQEEIRDMIEDISWALNVFKPKEINTYFTSDQIDRIHQICTDMAKQNYEPYSHDDCVLSIAHQFGWHDVLDDLEANDSFLKLWGTWPDQYSSAGDWALSLSMFDRDQLTQRLSAWVLNMNAKTAPKEVKERMKYATDEPLKAALAWSRTRPPLW